jgi:hypothetical protein
LRLLIPFHDFACFARRYEGDDSPARAAHCHDTESNFAQAWKNPTLLAIEDAEEWGDAAIF